MAETATELLERFMRARERGSPQMSETERLRVLGAEGQRQLIAAIARERPRSVSQLARIVGRLQPNVSRSLATLIKAGFVSLENDGRATVPVLTESGEKVVAALADEWLPAAPPAPETSSTLLSTVLPEATGDLPRDEVRGLLRLDFGAAHGETELDLNEFAVRLLTHWWRVLYRRDDPYRLVDLAVVDGQHRTSHLYALLARTLGDRVELSSRAVSPEASFDGLPHLTLSVGALSDLLLGNVARPLARYLEQGRRFDRPLHGLLNRLEDVSSRRRASDLAKTAGALGLIPHDLGDEWAGRVSSLLHAIPDETARLEFASAATQETFDATFEWARREVRNREQSNVLDRLHELHIALAAPRLRRGSPWQVGTSCAKQLRSALKMDEEASVGGFGRLVECMGGGRGFSSSEGGEEQLRAYVAHGDERPTVVVRRRSETSTMFSLARAIGDYLVFADREAPISDLYSDRQKVGRAFAAEFLAPAKGVIHLVDKEDMAPRTVAAHFGVSLEVISRQYRNNAGPDREPSLI